MTDYARAVTIRTALLAGLVANGSSAEVVQFDPMTTQGRPSGPAVLFQKLFDRRYGFAKRDDVPDPDEPTRMIHRETQYYESTYQFEAVGPSAQPGATLPTATPSDLVNLAAGVVQSDAFMDALRQGGLAVLRVTQVRNPFMQNDREQFEAAPSFDLVVTHEQIMLSTTPAAVVGELRMARV
jgi:hypothetical protein